MQKSSGSGVLVWFASFLPSFLALQSSKKCLPSKTFFLSKYSVKPSGNSFKFICGHQWRQTLQLQEVGTAWFSTECKLVEGAAITQSHLQHPDFRSLGSSWFADWSYVALQSACSASGILEVGSVSRIWLIRNSFLRGKEKMEIHCRTLSSIIGFSLRSN